MALMAFSMVPMDKGASFSKYVAKTLTVIAESGLPYRLNPMGTVVEGEWDELVALLTRCYRTLEAVSDRVSVSAKFDCRKGAAGAIDRKIESVQAEAGRIFET